jgi:cation diffusion facilitator CzcD-associated flavoprotein CzcO
MVNIQQFIFSLFVSRLPIQDSHVDSHNAKSILIVGAGSAGLAMLKTLLDLPDETRGGWDIVLYEQRRDVGGIW